MKKIILITILGLVAVVMIVQGVQSSESHPSDINVQNPSDNVVKKKNEFLLLHKTLDKLSETWPESKIRPYRKAIEKFPDVDACLITPKNADSINWSLIKTTAELEVCLSRIHTYLGDMQKSKEWFERQGFLVSVQSYTRGSPPVRFHSVNGIWLIPSSGPLKDRKSPLAGVRVRFEEFFASAGLSVGLEINQENVVTHIETGYSSK